MGFSDRGLIWNTIRGLFSWFDYIVYTVLGWFFQTIFYIANFQMSILYEEVQARIYVILGIFMLFKLVISFLTYMVNPDKISDKEQGVGKLITRVILVLIMFLGLPTLFTVMTDLQNRLIPVVPRIIIGQAAGGDFFEENEETGTTTMDVSGLGDSMALSVYRAFLRTNTSEECGVPPENDPTNPTASLWVDISDAVDHINDECPNNPDRYLYTYTPIVPVIVGIIMVVVVLGINVDVGIRSFKILILRAIAPIPILSYIDPKSSKDGAFSKWTKMLFSTWVSLFINLAIVYFVIYLIQMLFRADVWASFFGNFTSPNPIINALVLILVIIALLFFAREAPQFIMDALGIKSAGSFGKMLGVAAAGLGMAGAARASYQASRDADDALHRDHSFLRNVGAGLFGGIAGGMAGAQAAMGAKDHYMRASRDAIAKRNATTIAAGASGSTFGGRLHSSMEGFFMGETEAARTKRSIADMEAQKAAFETIKSRVSGEMVKKDWTWGNLGLKDANGNDLGLKANYKSFMAAKNAAASRGADKFEVQLMDRNGNVHTHEIDMQTANMQEGFLLKNNESDYLYQHVVGTAQDSDQVLADAITDAKLKDPNWSIDVSDSSKSRGSVTDSIDSLGSKITAAKRENARNEQNDRFSGSGK